MRLTSKWGEIMWMHTRDNCDLEHKVRVSSFFPLQRWSQILNNFWNSKYQMHTNIMMETMFVVTYLRLYSVYFNIPPTFVSHILNYKVRDFCRWIPSFFTIPQIAKSSIYWLVHFFLCNTRFFVSTNKQTTAEAIMLLVYFKF